MESCEAAVPFILLWAMLREFRSTAVSPESCSAAPWSRFLRDYATRGTNALLWVSLIAATVLLAGKLVRLVKLWSLGSKIPGPPCSFLFGHSKYTSGFGSGGNLIGYVAKLHEKYGPIVRLWLGPTQLIVSVKDTSMIEAVLVKAVDKLSLTGRAFSLAFGRSGLFASSFEEVQQGRESFAMNLNGKLLERANTIPLKVVECVMGRVESIMVEGVRDCKSISQHMAFSLVGATLFGEAFLTWPDATSYEELLVLIAKDACFWASYSVPPVWRREFWRYQSLCRKVEQLTQELIGHCKRYYKAMEQVDRNPFNDNSDTMRDAEIYASKLLLKEIDGHLITEDEPFGNVVCLMLHGCLTSTSLIWSILTRIALYPEIQENVYSNIKSVQLNSLNPDSYDVKKMHFLLATVYESARLLPGGPLLQRCLVNCGTDFDLKLESSITIPAGAIVIVPLQLVHLDKTMWGKDACQFKPHRFLCTACHHDSSNGENFYSVSNTGKPYGFHKSEENPSSCTEQKENAAFLPFGSGSRACSGREFTILAISTFFAALVQDYEIRLEDGAENVAKPALDGFFPQVLPSPKIGFVKRNKCE